MTFAVHHFRDHAMATHFEVRIADEDATYARSGPAKRCV
jgi:hypothetical protein